MVIPTWAIVTAAALLYVFIDFAEAVILNLIAGKRGRSGLDGVEGVGLIFFWPLWNIFWSVIWIVERYDFFLSAVRKRGEESVMPPKNEHPGK